MRIQTEHGGSYALQKLHAKNVKNARVMEVEEEDHAQAVVMMVKQYA